MEKSNASRNGIGHFFRVLRPLIWWLILVLVLYGIRTHERLMQLTRLDFTMSLQGQPIDAVAMLDGKPALNGQKISLGRHTFSITYSKADPFSTNLFIWYGPHDLGNIRLKRSVGTLQVQATPPASTITISGPEFSTNLYDSGGISLNVPTDQYTIRAEYPHWSQTQNKTVLANLASSCVFAPRLGALRLSCNKDGTTYRLESTDGQVTDSGNLPATVTGLPVGGYQLTVSYHNRQLQTSAAVETGTTNDVPLQFILGALRLETTPAGADVRMSDGSYMGRTPLVVADLTPQTTRFNLSLAGYEPVSVALDITADQTNSYNTNLVSVNYVSAIQQGRAFLAVSNFEAAAQAARAALTARPNDATALALQSEATEHLNAERKRLDMLRRPERTFAALCADYQDANLFRAYELKTSKPAYAVEKAIVSALKQTPDAFKIISDNQSKPETYAAVAQQTFTLGILGGTEREALIVIGQAKNDETQIWFKVLEYEVQHTVTAQGFSLHDNKRLIAINPSRIQMNSGFEAQLRNGVQIVTGRIKQGIGQAWSMVQ